MAFFENETITSYDLLGTYGGPHEDRSRLQEEMAGLKDTLQSTLSRYDYTQPIEEVIFSNEAHPHEVQELIDSVREKAFTIACANAQLIRVAFSDSQLRPDSVNPVSGTDLVQNAIEDLMHAACTFDARKGEFSSYVIPMLRWNHAGRQSRESINPQSTDGEYLYAQMRNKLLGLSKQRNERPHIEEVALWVSVKQLHKAYQAKQAGEVSFDESLQLFRVSLQDYQFKIKRLYSYDRYPAYQPTTELTYRFSHHSFCTVEELMLYRQYLIALRKGNEFDFLDSFRLYVENKRFNNPRRIKHVRRLLMLWNLKNILSLDYIKTVSLKDSTDELGTTSVELVEQVPSEETSTEEAALREVTREDVRKAVDRLPEKERRVLELRYGLLDNREYTLSEVAQELGLESTERVRQIEGAALRHLRNPNVSGKFITR